MGAVSAPDGWEVWSNESGGRLVLAFRPDVFDGESYPAECMATVYVSRRKPGRRLRRTREPSGSWHVSLRLEPEVRVESADESHATREAAVAAALALAERFAAGDVDYRAAYQVPRDDYLDELDERTG